MSSVIYRCLIPVNRAGEPHENLACWSSKAKHSILLFGAAAACFQQEVVVDAKENKDLNFSEQTTSKIHALSNLTCTSVFTTYVTLKSSEWQQVSNVYLLMQVGVWGGGGSFHF